MVLFMPATSRSWDLDGGAAAWAMNAVRNNALTRTSFEECMRHRNLWRRFYWIGLLTLMDAMPSTVSNRALMVAYPSAAAVTQPVGDTRTADESWLHLT